MSTVDESRNIIATFSMFSHTADMALKFHGTCQELQDLILPLDLDGDWEEQPNGVHKFKCRNRAGLLWSETKGTIWFDGPPALKAALASQVEGLLGDETAAIPAASDSTIFVVHGRDHEARDQLELVGFHLAG